MIEHHRSFRIQNAKSATRRHAMGWFGALTLAPFLPRAGLAHDLVSEDANSSGAKRDLAKIVHESEHMLDDLLYHSKASDSIMDHLRQARAVIVIPGLFKAGFLVGLEAGTGLLLARTQDRSWSYPAFLKFTGASLGFQFGYQEARLLLLVMTDGGFSNLLKRPVSIGGELSAAIGGVGDGYNAATTANLGVDLISYMDTSGLFLGASLEGSLLQKADDLTGIYYGEDQATIRTVVLDGQYANPDANRLRQILETSER
ncbi:MAG: lipid-binding SYLF domain-containing protein [Pseudomonadota bacterium]